MTRLQINLEFQQNDIKKKLMKCITLKFLTADYVENNQRIEKTEQIIRELKRLLLKVKPYIT